MRVDNFLVPMQCTGEFGLLSPGESEQPQYGATRVLFLSCVPLVLNAQSIAKDLLRVVLL